MFQCPTTKWKVYVGLAVTVLVLVIVTRSGYKGKKAIEWIPKYLSRNEIGNIHTQAHADNSSVEIKTKTTQYKVGDKRSGYKGKKVIQWIPEYLNIRNEIRNSQTHAHAGNSLVEIKTKTTQYKVGDRIEIGIQLRDLRNVSINKGGDILRIWMTEETLRASAGGYIIDYHNGSFLGIVEALWAGSPKIKIAIGCTKEHIGMYLNYLEKYGTFYFVIGIFEKEHHKGNAETQCTSMPNSPLYTKGSVCNFTADNYNMSFYCGKPVGYECKDWIKYRHHSETPALDTETYRFYRKRVYQKLQSITIKVKEDLARHQRLSSPAKSCSELPAAETWTSRTPAGYMYGDKWTSLQCSINFPRTTQAYTRCLTNTPLIFIGDSTTRIFFTRLMEFLNLTLDTPEVKVFDDKSWQRHVHASSPDHGISMEWMPHEHPFASAGFRRNLRSVSARLNEIGSNRNVIVLVHWYLHPARYLSPHFYRQHVSNAVVAIKSLLQRSPKAKILIKGPHSHTYPGTVVPYDYVRMFMEQILYEEFKDIQNSVYYVDYWDMTLGNENVNAHPTDPVNDIQIHNFLSFVCPT